MNIVIQKLKALEKSVNKDSLSSEDLSPDYRQEIFDKILEVIYGNLDLNVSLMSLFVNKNKSIDSYFYLLELMIRCKESAVRVSPQVWAGIESRMVTVPAE